jgi:hypothetical protein
MESHVDLYEKKVTLGLSPALPSLALIMKEPIARTK